MTGGEDGIQGTAVDLDAVGHVGVVVDRDEELSGAARTVRQAHARRHLVDDRPEFVGGPRDGAADPGRERDGRADSRRHLFHPLLGHDGLEGSATGEVIEGERRVGFESIGASGLAGRVRVRGPRDERYTAVSPGCVPSRS
jgi:hypothetical protein